MDVNGVTQAQRRTPNAKRRRLFTLQQANSTLPLVRRIVADIVKQYKKVCALEDKCHIKRPSVSNEEQALLRRQYASELAKLRDLAEELSAIGCELKDWRRGLIDFRARHEGREVDLCWKLGEESIQYWHEPSAGYAGRQKVDENFGAHLEPV